MKNMGDKAGLVPYPQLSMASGRDLQDSWHFLRDVPIRAALVSVMACHEPETALFCNAKGAAEAVHAVDWFMAATMECSDVPA